MSDKSVWNPEELTCKPLRSVEDMVELLQDPPPWRSLCAPLTPHSPLVLKNIEINQNEEDITVEKPQTFCHFVSDSQVTVTDVKRYKRKMLPKTLICHDMANGYHDDCFVDGTGKHDAYTFYNWAAIDIFCYFSHHFITIPPLGWINVAHAHGTKVLGTVITEWAHGEATWDKILSSESEWKSFASRLVAVAKIMKFDGWLLNVENKVKDPGSLVQFVRFLHGALHEELQEPELIWYDSVTVAGDLAWQNTLNQHNQAFFDACDGIFTNYTWSEALVAAGAARAAARRTDVYVGVDVWGRNFHGGGQFNTQEAVKIVHKHGCSLAIFAPAWTHEAIPDQDAPSAGRLEQFLLRERAFWGSLWPFLQTRLPSRLPFQTSFCRGQGIKRRLYGEVLGPVPWYNLRHMQYQPNSNHGPHGYILTTVDNFKRLSKQGLVEHDNGVIKESFLEAEAVADSAEATNHTQIDQVIVVNEEQSLDTAEADETTFQERKSAKRKMKDVLRKMFKVKTRNRNNTDSIPSTELPETVQPSVNVQAKDRNNKEKYLRYAVAKVPGEQECLEPYFADSFTGGSCLKVNPCNITSPENRTIRLFHTDFRIEGALVACVVTKTLPNIHHQYLDLILQVTDFEGQSKEVKLVGGAEGEVGEVMYPVNMTSQEQFRELQKYLLLNEAGFYVPTENSHGWVVRYYCGRVSAGGARVTAVCCRAGAGRGPLLLGHVGFCNMNEVNDEGTWTEATTT